MSGSHVLRVLLCGMIAGVVWSLLTTLALLLLGSDLLAAVEAGGRHERSGGPVLFAIDLLMGVWAIWVYAMIAPGFGSKLRAAAATGLAWWVLKTLQSAKLVAVGFIPVEVTVGPAVVTLITATLAAVVGAQVYDRTTERASPEASEGP
jgi:hypothetical protein